MRLRVEPLKENRTINPQIFYTMSLKVVIKIWKVRVSFEIAL